MIIEQIIKEKKINNNIKELAIKHYHLKQENILFGKAY